MVGEDLIKSWRQRSLNQCPHVELTPHLGLSWAGVEYLRKNQPKLVIGADEVGFGALAGPVTVCAFAAKPLWSLQGLRDSKKLSPRRRAEFTAVLTKINDCWYSLCSIDNERIDRWGLEQARQVAFEECLENLRERIGEDFNYSLIALDGTVQVRHIDHVAFPKADDIVPQISAASVIAKYTRDLWMIDVAHKKYPMYRFDENAGYGTDAHRRVLSAAGPCPLHRRSFKVKPYQPPKEKHLT